MNVYVIDFETAYSKTYSLTKLTTQQYIDDPQFEVIGVAVKKNSEPTVWCDGTTLKIEEFLAGFDFENAAVVAHNALFDMSILSWQFGIKPKLIIDTLSMARAVHGTEVGNSLAKLAAYYELGEKGTEVVNALGKRRRDFSKEELNAYASYCVNDVELTYELFRRLAPHFNKTEINLIDMTVRMHSEPSLVLDIQTLDDHLINIRDRKEQLLQQCAVSRADLMSNPKFAAWLRKFGVAPPMKISARTGKETYAFAKTDEGMKALAEHPNPDVQTIVAARLGTKSTIEETRTERFINIAQVAGVLPVPLKYYGAMTGRWAATDKINLQNLPRGSVMKKAIQAPDGFVIVGADLSNIELRVGLYFAGQWDKLRLLREGVDLYKDFAAPVFGVAYDDITEEQRFIGKTSQLSLIYGTGAVKLRNAIKSDARFGTDIGEEKAKEIVDRYRTDYENVKQAWYAGDRVIKAMKSNIAQLYEPNEKLALIVDGENGIKLPSGLMIQYPDLSGAQNGDRGGWLWTYKQRNERVKIYGPKVFQNVVQALARCVMGEAMVRIHKRYPIVLTIHDACYSVVPEQEAEDARRFIITELRKAPEWAEGIPLDAEGGFGKDLSFKMSKL
jgi:DNA polymerase I-like protein with 3'-5' exonuclease and polymerase domains